MTLTHILTHVYGRLYTASFPLLREEFSFSIQQLGLIAAIPPLTQAIFSIPFGILTDKVGSKKMLFVSLVFAVVGSVIVGFTSNPFFLIGAICLVYLNTTVYHPASYSYTTRLFARKDRPKALGIHGAGGTLGVALGPLTLSLFLGFLGLTWRHVYLFWAIPIAIGSIFLLKLQDIESIESDERSAVYKESEEEDAKSLFTLGLLMFLVYTAMRTISVQMLGTFMPIYIVDEVGFSVEQMGIIYGSLSITGLVSATIGGLLASRFGAKRWLALTIVLNIVLLSLVPIVPGKIPFIITYLSYGFSQTFGMAARSSIIANLTPRGQRGVGYSLLFLPGSIMGAVSPIIAATLIDHYGIGSLFPVSIIIMALSIAVLVLGVPE
jgi:FSR family fosmidomycin resistance protein-like MFS transporter